MREMHINWLSLSLLLVGCTTSHGEYYDLARNDTPQTTSPSNSVIFSEIHRMIAAYILRGDCPNWNAALAVAKSKMGCNGAPLPSDECKEELPCDVCQFIREGSWPEAHIVDFPAKEFLGIKSTIYGAVILDSRWKETCPVDDKTRVQFKQTLCFGEGLWGFDKVNTLAKAMVHEALHLCRLVGGEGAATVDKGFWDYLFCMNPDAADVVDICWASRGS
jgi:hypothetical protein